MSNEAQYVVPPGVEQLVERLQREIAQPSYTEKWFDWQTLPLTHFYSGMNIAREKLGPGRHKFLDVGSGIGAKLYIADTLGFEPWGIEHNARYIEISGSLFPGYPIHCGSALYYTDYKAFDLIYSYRCARSDELQEELNEYIVKNMKENAIYFCVDTLDTTDKLMAINGVTGLAR